MDKKKSGFDKIWENAIVKAIDFCYEDMDQSFCERAKVVKRDYIEYKPQLRKLYHEKREWLKIKYLPHKDHPILDFHKLSAIICRCIIGIKPIFYDGNMADYLFNVIQSQKISPSKKLAWQITNIYVNYRVAFLAAAGVAYDDLLSWAQETINFLKEQRNGLTEIEEEKLFIFGLFIEKMISGSALFLYQKSDKHDDFESSMIVSLMKNDILMRDFDYLSFAANMFQWQEYTKLMLFMNIINENKQKIKHYDFTNILDLCKVATFEKRSPNPGKYTISVYSNNDAE